MAWFRFYTDTIQDRKIRRLSLAHRWLWVAVLSLAKESPIPGHLLLSRNVSVTFQDISDAANIPIEDVESGIERFVDFDMLELDEDGGHYIVTHWNKRQFISDDATLRVQKHRENKKGNVEETLPKRSGNVSSNDIETHQSTETETDQKDWKRIYEVIKKFAPYGISSAAEHDIQQFMDKGLELELLTVAFRIGKQNNAKDIGSYAASILRNWLNDGITTVEQYELSESQRQTSAGGERSDKRQRNSRTNRTNSQSAERQRIFNATGEY